MKLLGNTQVTTIEEPGRLEFVVVRDGGWIDRVAPPAIVFTLVVGAWITHHYVFSLFCVLASAAFLAKSVSHPSTRLFVSQSELVARGNTNKTFTDEIRIKSSEIRSLRYFVGGEDDPSGLYVCGKGFQTCALSGLNKVQADAIADQIRQKFPDLEQGDTNPNSMLFGKKDDPISLGLANLK